MLCCFLPAFQESTSLKELQMNFPVAEGPSNLPLENMLTHTQSLRSLTLIITSAPLEDRAVAAASSGLKKNTTLQELTLEFERATTTTISPIFDSLCDHPRLRRLCLRGHNLENKHLTGLETLLLSDTSIIAELDIPKGTDNHPIMGMTCLLRYLACRPVLAKLEIHSIPLGCYKTELLGKVLCNTPSLQTLILRGSTLESARLAELAPAFYHNTSIKELDTSNSELDVRQYRYLWDILRHNKTITTLDLSYNLSLGDTGGLECIADGLSSNTTLLKIDLSMCNLCDEDVSIMVQTLGPRNTMLQKPRIEFSYIYGR